MNKSAEQADDSPSAPSKKRKKCAMTDERTKEKRI